MYLVFDIGGTSIRLSTSQDGTSLGEVKKIATLKNFPVAMLSIKQTVKELVGPEKIQAAAGGVRALDKTKTKLLSQPHFPLWVGESLKEELEKILTTKVILENDAAVAGLGEAMFGAGKNHAIVVYYTLSTGVGGVRIVDGKIDKSAQGFEPGNQIIDLEGSTLEAFISGEALLRKYQTAASEINDPLIWDQVAKYLAIGLNNSIVHWSPDVIVIGGSVSNSLPLDKVEAYLKQYLRIFPEPPPIKKVELADNAGLYGALALLRNG